MASTQLVKTCHPHYFYSNRLQHHRLTLLPLMLFLQTLESRTIIWKEDLEGVSAKNWEQALMVENHCQFATLESIREGQ